MKKVRVTIPYFFKQSLREDLFHFNIPLSKLGNGLFRYYSTKNIEKINILGDDTEIIQFNLNTTNEEIYFKVLQEQEMDTEAEYFRSILFHYLSKPRYRREEIIFSNHFKVIKEAIDTNKRLNIKYKNEIRTVSPYFIKEGDRESSSYLFCYCETNNNYRNYRVCNLNKVLISKLNIEKKDIQYINEVKKNFDPFNSYRKKVKVKFTEEGLNMLKIKYYNRPKLLEINREIYTFQCSIDQGKFYFSKFLSEVEILEPVELREWFKNEFKKGITIYD
jgi:hypothetical protein